MNLKNLLPAIFIVCLLSGQQATAQFNAINTGKLQVYAFVKQGDEPLKKVIVTLYEDVENNGNWVQNQQMRTQANGEFSFILDYNSKYMVEVTKANYITKKISFDTNVYGKTITSQDFYFAVDFVPGSNTPASDIPVGNVFYHTKKNKFDYELNYAKAEAEK